ncbi:Uncharacterized protein TCM_029467 [Theobroma cacao]|uniref:Uncharacterized protein n=1 Tax=Theobroma cacao TaxID=3641 RepID=A0A061GKU9_THECC|nr:Uncharacterized protein TCM_029467 [Theobroma cacao]
MKLGAKLVGRGSLCHEKRGRVRSYGDHMLMVMGMMRKKILKLGLRPFVRPALIWRPLSHSDQTIYCP